MKIILFLMMVLFVTQDIVAQKFVLMKESRHIFNSGKISKDSCVYRVEGYDQLIASNKFEDYINADLLLSAKAWFDWLSWQVLPRELHPVIKKADLGMSQRFPEGWIYGERRNRYKGLMFEFLLDGYGNMITVSFYVDKEIRDKIKEKHLMKMYNAIMKYKMPSIIVKEILSSDQVKNLSPDSIGVISRVNIGVWIEYFEELKDFDWQELKERRRKSIEKRQKEGFWN